MTKASALTYLLDKLNMDQKDLIAFGDEHNDTDMLALAGHGYAMKKRELCPTSLRGFRHRFYQ